MQMVGQVDHLPDAAHVGEQPQRLLGAKMVEGLHDVVGDERRRGTRLGEFVVARDPQRKVKLEAASFESCSAAFEPPSAPSAINVSLCPLGSAVRPR